MSNSDALHFRQRPLVLLPLVAVAVLLCYLPTFAWLAGRYRDPSSDWAHGPLVPMVSAWWIARRRRSLAELCSDGDWRALPFVIAALALVIAGTALRIDFLGGASLFVLLPSLTALLVGFPVLARSAFSFGFLGFALPLPLFVVAELAQTLKEWVLTSCSFVLGMFAEGVRVEGSYLILPGVEGRLLVDDECSGLHSLVALVALGTLMAATAKRPLWTRASLVLLSVPIALLSNLLRVLALCAIASGGGTSAAVRWHDLSGLLVYAVAIVCYVLLDRLLPIRPEAAR